MRSLRIFGLAALLVLGCSLLAPGASALAAQSRYFTVRWSNPELLRDFNDNLMIGRLGRFIQKKNIVTVEDEVYAKLDVILEKAQLVLDMYPPKMKVTVVLLPDKNAVAAVYQQKYGKEANNIAYYSLSENTVYVSVDDVNLRVIAHELGHAIVNHYFKERPPYQIHELMAQFTEKHITD
ncbi:MAG: hypothetical protein LBU39_01645 [Desulfobulbaceae bacterium]|jgi:hypothetical protein|nr:hypothetical protein [Desulfobulbaceae bacterium]